jgi:hypothetical protein
MDERSEAEMIEFTQRRSAATGRPVAACGFPAAGSTIAFDFDESGLTPLGRFAVTPSHRVGDDTHRPRFRELACGCVEITCEHGCPVEGILATLAIDPAEITCQAHRGLYERS